MPAFCQKSGYTASCANNCMINVYSRSISTRKTIANWCFHTIIQLYGISIFTSIVVAVHGTQRGVIMGKKCLATCVALGCVITTMGNYESSSSWEYVFSEMNCKLQVAVKWELISGETFIDSCFHCHAVTMLCPGHTPHGICSIMLRN